jgi:hypothetical protein
MRLSKIYDNQELLEKARDVAERQSVKNKGAYFMKMLKDIKKINPPAGGPKFAHKKPVTKLRKQRLNI